MCLGINNFIADEFISRNPDHSRDFIPILEKFINKDEYDRYINQEGFYLKIRGNLLSVSSDKVNFETFEFSRNTIATIAGWVLLFLHNNHYGPCICQVQYTSNVKKEFLETCFHTMEAGHITSEAMSLINSMHRMTARYCEDPNNEPGFYYKEFFDRYDTYLKGCKIPKLTHIKL